MPRRQETRTVRLEVATPEDAGPLAVVAAVAFYDDRKWQPEALREANLSQEDPDQGPPHVSYDWTRHVLESLHSEERRESDATFYKVVLGQDRLVGGLFVVARPDLGDDEWRCEGIYVHPDYQNRGIGKEILRQMYREHPDAVRWTLDTPEWSVRNHAFYENMGFTRFHITESPELPFRLYDYENTLSQEERLKL